MFNNNHKLQGLKSLRVSGQEIFTVEALSAYTGLSKSFIYKLCQQKKIPFSRPNGKLLFFSKPKIDAWLLSNPVEPGDDIEAEAINYIASNPWKGGQR